MKVHNFSETPSVVNRYLMEMRSTDVQTDPLRFRRNLERIGELMAYEISKTMHYKEVEVQTPLAKAVCTVPDEKVVLGTIFRAGVPFHYGFLNVMDSAENAFVSAYRKYKEKESFEICIEYLASPRLEGKSLILVDPMLATGASMELSYRALITKGVPEKLHLAAVIASQQAVDYLQQVMPENCELWLGVIDPEVNSHKYIVPGLGDAGDLAYGHKE